MIWWSRQTTPAWLRPFGASADRRVDVGEVLRTGVPRWVERVEEQMFYGRRMWAAADGHVAATHEDIGVTNAARK